MNNNEINEKVISIKNLKSQIEELQKQMEEQKEILKNEMLERNEDHLSTDIFNVSYIQIVSNRFDTTTFKKEHEDIYNSYLVESVSNRFSIK